MVFTPIQILSVLIVTDRFSPVKPSCQQIHEICGIAQQGKKGGEKDGVKGKGGYEIPLDESFEHPRRAAGGTQKTG